MKLQFINVYILKNVNDADRWLMLAYTSLFLISFGLVLHTTFADTITTSFPVGNNPDGIGVNPNTNMIYVTNHNDNTTSVIDGSTNTVVKTIPVGYALVTVNPITNEIYVDAGKNGVAVINGSTENIVTTIEIPVGNGAVNTKMNKIYEAGCCGKDVVSVIDGSTNAVIGTIPVETELSGVVAVNSKTNMIYATTICVGCGKNTSVLVIDGSTNSLVTNISLPFVWQSIDVNPYTNMVYAAAGGNVYVINGSTNQITSTINGVIGGMPAIAVNPTTNKIYVADSRNNVVNIIDGATNSIDKISGFNVPDAIRVNPNTNMVYVANGGNNTVSVLNGNSPQTTSKLTVKSQDNNGNTITGFYTVLSKNGNMISTGFTPASFTLNDSQTYTVHVGDFGKFIFNYWSDTGSTSATRDISITSDDNITAVYKTIPQPPTGLMATAASSSQISLSWTAPGNNGGSAVTGYMIERSADNGSTWSTIVVNTDNTSTTYSDTGLQSNLTYTYQVSAINSVGTSSPSNTASTTTSDIAIASGIILNNIQSTSGTTSSSNQITLSGFNAGTGNNQLLLVGITANNNIVASVTFNGTPLTKAASSFSNNDAEFWYMANPSGTGNIIVTMNGITQAVIGAYSFSGVDQTVPIPTTVINHNTSAGSPAISITTKYPNDMVLDLSSIYGGSTLGSPTCTQQWDLNVPNAITGASSSTMVSSPATVTCKWTASSADFWDDVAVELKAASTSTTTSLTVPGAPTGLAATGGNTQVTLSWTAPSSDGGSAITGYNVYRGTTAGGEGSTHVASGITSTTYTDTGLTNGQAYYYTVRAVNSVGTSSPSNEAGATPASGSSGTSGITLNNVQSTSGTTSSNQIALSNFNTGTGTNNLLVVGISANNAAVSSVTFGGVQLTKAASSFSNNDAEFWYLKNPTGTGNILVTMSGTTSAVVGAYSFSGVDQTSPIPTIVINHNTSAGSPAISITTKHVNDLVLDLPSIWGGVTLGSSTCTQQWDVNVPNAITGASSSAAVSMPSTVSCSWTASSADFWDDVAVELKAAG